MESQQYDFNYKTDAQGYTIVGSRTLSAEYFSCEQCKKELDSSTGAYYCPTYKQVWCEWCFLDPKFTHHAPMKKGKHIDWKVDRLETTKHNPDE